MKNRAIEIWVGVFVVLGIAALLMLSLQVSGLSNFYTTNEGYTVKAGFANIGGLKVRSKVTISGVTIGRVTHIELSKNSFGDYEAMVTLSIDSRFNTIPDDTAAKILTAGLLGDNYVSLTPGQAPTYLAEGSAIEITSQAVLLEDLISKFITGGGEK